MRWILFTLVLAATLFLSGCLGRFAANQGRKQAARRSDHYIKKYAEPELEALYAGDPDAQVRVKNVSREGRNYVADVIVDSNGRKERKQVVVDKKGRVVNDGR